MTMFDQGVSGLQVIEMQGVAMLYGSLPLAEANLENWILQVKMVSELKWLNSVKDYGTKLLIFLSH